MGKSKKIKISVSGESNHLSANPFAALDSIASDLPTHEVAKSPTLPEKINIKKGRVDIKRATGGRAGKTVTLIEAESFTRLSDDELKSLALRMKKSCGTGGTVKGKSLEIQGDKRKDVASFLEKEGYRVVLAGG